MTATKPNRTFFRDLLKNLRDRESVPVRHSQFVRLALKPKCPVEGCSQFKWHRGPCDPNQGDV